jgi:antitoxin component of RelBE/YafQ-DinJ toxin-antitoxin module
MAEARGGLTDEDAVMVLLQVVQKHKNIPPDIRLRIRNALHIEK